MRAITKISKHSADRQSRDKWFSAHDNNKQRTRRWMLFLLLWLNGSRLFISSDEWTVFAPQCRLPADRAKSVTHNAWMDPWHRLWQRNGNKSNKRRLMAMGQAIIIQRGHHWHHAPVQGESTPSFNGQTDVRVLMMMTLYPPGGKILKNQFHASTSNYKFAWTPIIIRSELSRRIQTKKMVEQVVTTLRLTHIQVSNRPELGDETSNKIRVCPLRQAERTGWRKTVVSTPGS